MINFLKRLFSLKSHQKLLLAEIAQNNTGITEFGVVYSRQLIESTEKRVRVECNW